MARSHQKLVQPDDVDVHCSDAQYRVIVEIPGFVLRKPIECALVEISGNPKEEERFMARHHLPTLDGEGYQLHEFGRTESEAFDNLIGLITGFYDDFQRLEEVGVSMSQEVSIQKSYLECLMCRQS